MRLAHLLWSLFRAICLAFGVLHSSHIWCSLDCTMIALIFGNTSTDSRVKPNISWCDSYRLSGISIKYCRYSSCLFLFVYICSTCLLQNMTLHFVVGQRSFHLNMPCEVRKPSCIDLLKSVRVRLSCQTHSAILLNVCLTEIYKNFYHRQLYVNRGNTLLQHGEF